MQDMQCRIENAEDSAKLMSSSLTELMNSIERTMGSRFAETSHISHLGDRGDNREEVLREFLERYLPSQFGLTKGQVVTKDGKSSHRRIS